MSERGDLVVVGGGPAGAVSAWLAAQDGQRVFLIDPGKTPSRIEGMSPRLAAWLQRRMVPDIGAILIPAARHSLWSDTTHEGNRELLVERPAFDQCLRNAAVAAGAMLIVDTAEPKAGVARLSAGGVIEAPLVLDARGRRGGTRDGIRRGPPTISIGTWLDGPSDTGSQTFVMPFDDGWAWLACMGGRSWLQVTLDAADPAGGTPAERLSRSFDQCSHRLPSGLTLGADHLVIRESSPTLSAFPDDLSLLPVGDAAAAMDPLSGHGMFWAVSGALATAAVRRTLAAHPDGGGEDLARRFLDQRTRDLFLRQARIGRDFIRAEAARSALPFWRARRSFPDDASAHPTVGLITTRRQVVVNGGQLSEQEVLVSPRSPGGIVWFNGLSAAELWRTHSAGNDTAELLDRFGSGAANFVAWLANEMAGSTQDAGLDPRRSSGQSLTTPP